jgi:peptide/nickel transport system substrate-binding protein
MRKQALCGVALAAFVAISLTLLPIPAMSQGKDSLGFGDNVSAQVKRANQTGTEPLQPVAQKPSGCLIATAAFGSELTPQVQFLRGFRDNHILSTTAGSSFMNVFNSWYYSFSPSVADYERANPWAQATIKTAIYPLLGILQVAEKGYGMSTGEGGAVVAGFAASTLIGAVYLSPAAVALRNRAPGKKLLVALGISVIASLAIIAAGIATGNAIVLMVSTAFFVLSSIGVGLFAVMAMAKKIEEKRRSRR